jgi:flagellar biosynthesis protein FliQ
MTLTYIQKVEIVVILAILIFASYIAYSLGLFSKNK